MLHLLHQVFWSVGFLVVLSPAIFQKPLVLGQLPLETPALYNLPRLLSEQAVFKSLAQVYHYLPVFMMESRPAAVSVTLFDKCYVFPKGTAEPVYCHSWGATHSNRPQGPSHSSSGCVWVSNSQSTADGKAFPPWKDQVRCHIESFQLIAFSGYIQALCCFFPHSLLLSSPLKSKSIKYIHFFWFYDLKQATSS